MKKTLRLLTFALLVFTGLPLLAQESWTRKADLNTQVDIGTAGCAIGNKGYVVVGNTPGSWTPPLDNDFWEYDPSTDVWTKKANTPEKAPARFAFAIGSKGYFQFAGGIWEYDVPSNTWTRKIPLPVANAQFATGFTIGNTGYVAFSMIIPYQYSFSANQDVWAYDQVTDSWTRKADFPGVPSFNATGFSIGRKAYVAQSGTNPANKSDFWEYDAATNSWAQKASFGGANDLGSTGFSIDGKGYISTCSVLYQSGYLYANTTYLWKYTPSTNTWDTTLAFPGRGRVHGVSFSVNNKAYFGIGDLNQSRGLTPAFNDLWEYTALIDSVPTQAPVGTGNGLTGIYFNGITLSGIPLLNRVDTSINFDLSYGKTPLVLSPAPGIVPPDGYSVRWTGQVQPRYSETYTFYTLSDDGIRLWVNGVQLVDNWVNQGATEKSGTITLVAGQKYDIKIEYYENAGDAVTKLSWSSASTPKSVIPKSQLYTIPLSMGTGTGLYASYYNGMNLAGAPLLNRIDSIINFQFTYASQPLRVSPAPGIVPDDHYSARWTGEVQPQYAETYTFYTVSDDGVRLWVNGVKLVDNWVDQGATEKSGTISLLAGQHYDIVIEYYENAGDAVTQLYWSSASTPKAIVPKSQLYPVARGLLGNYYNGIDLLGSPILTRIDSTINFELSYGKIPQVLSPAPGIVPEDKFSVRWTGQLQAMYSEPYRFSALSDDGIRGTIMLTGPSTMFGDWSIHGVRETVGSGQYTLVAGKKYDIVIEYFENTGDAVAKLMWESPSTPKSIIPQSQLYPPSGSSARMMETPVAAVALAQPIAISNNAVSIRPNPVVAGQPAVLQIQSRQSAIALLTVTGSNGVTSKASQLYLVPGQNTVTVNTSDLPRGVYFVRVSNGQVISSKKLVIQ